MANKNRIVTAYNFYETGNKMVMSGSSFLMRCGPGARLFFCEFESKYPVIVGGPTFEPFPSGKNMLEPRGKFGIIVPADLAGLTKFAINLYLSILSCEGE